MNAQIRPPARRPGPLKRLIRPLIKPDVFDFWASRLHRTWTWERPLARLVAREAASADAVTLLFKPNRHWAGHRAGQHVNLGIEIDGVRLTRSYSLTAPPVLVVDEGEVDIRLQRSGRTLRVPRGESLLVALEQQGLKPPSGCRMGICNTCACGKSSGSTRHLPSGELLHEPTQALKLCIHSAATDLELDL